MGIVNSNQIYNIDRMDRNEFFKAMTERTGMFLSDAVLDKIKNQTVALAGLGGIGSMILELLVRFGVTKFRLLDMDKYEISNMNRQIFSTMNNLGVWKVDVAMSRIKEINPYAKVEMAIREKANKENVRVFMEGADIFILGTDLPSSIILFHEYAKFYEIPLIDGHCISITGGSVQVFDYRKQTQICRNKPFKLPILNSLACKILGYQEMLDDITDEGIGQLDNEKVTTASLGFVTNLVGCMVVAETIKILTGIGKTYYYPKEIYVDLFNPKMKIRSARSIRNILLRLNKRFLKHKVSR